MSDYKYSSINKKVEFKYSLFNWDKEEFEDLSISDDWGKLTIDFIYIRDMDVDTDTEFDLDEYEKSRSLFWDFMREILSELE